MPVGNTASSTSGQPDLSMMSGGMNELGARVTKVPLSASTKKENSTALFLTIIHREEKLHTRRDF